MVFSDPSRASFCHSVSQQPLAESVGSLTSELHVLEEGIEPSEPEMYNQAGVLVFGFSILMSVIRTLMP